MRHALILAAAFVTTWLSVAPPLAAAEDVPQRKPGLWQITTVGAGSGTNTVRTCIGEDDKILTPEGAGDCSEPSVKSGGSDTTIVDVVCLSGPTKETISGAFTGDFGTRYRAQVKMTFDPPPKGLPPHWGVTIDGKYLGPDCSSAEAPPRDAN